MENRYGITVTNKYDLFLNEDEDPLDILRQQEEALLKKKEDKAKKDTKNEKTKSAGKSKKDKKVTPAAETKTKVLDQNANRKEAPPQKGFGAIRQMSDNKPMDKRPLKEGNRDLPPRRDRQDRGDRPDRPPSSEFRDRGEGGERGRGRGRGGDRRGRGGRGRGGGGPGFDRFGKREFERHSGSDRTGGFSSGIKPVDKKDGGGAHNWGTINDDLEEQLNDTQTSQEENPDWAVQTEEVENQDPNDLSTDADAADVAPEEEPVREMTLDEWKAQQQQTKSQTQFNLRRAGEGVDESQWKKTYVYKKPIQESDESEEESEEEEDSEDEAASKRVNIEITFYDNPRRGGRGGRRGRGQGRGRGDFMGGSGRGRGGDGERGEGGGGRGGGRGFGQPRGRGEGRGRGGDRGGGGGRGGDRAGGQRKEIVPNTEDESEFPSLGK